MIEVSFTFLFLRKPFGSEEQKNRFKNIISYFALCHTRLALSAKVSLEEQINHLSESKQFCYSTSLKLLFSLIY